MLRPLLLLLTVACPIASAQEIYLGNLSRSEFLLELEPMRQRCQKELILAKAHVASARSRLEKQSELEKKGYSSVLSVKRHEQRLAGNESRFKVWQAFSRAIELTGLEIREPSQGSFVAQTSVQIPGITQQFGNIQLFAVRCQPTTDQLEAGIAYLQARKVPTNLGTELGELDRQFLSGLGEAIKQLESAYASDVGRYQTRLFHAASNHLVSKHGIEQLDRDIARLRKAIENRTTENLSEFPWLSQSLGLLGSGWRCSAESAPDIVALCLPIAKAQHEAAGTLEVAQLQLELAKHRLNVKSEALARNVASDLEHEGARIELEVATNQLEANRAMATSHELGYRQLLELTDPSSRLPESSQITELAEFEQSAREQLVPLLDSPRFVYGWLKTFEGWLHAWNSLENAKRNQQFQDAQTQGILALKKTTANERKRVTLQAQLANAIQKAAAEQLRLKNLEFEQWLAIAELSRTPRASSNTPIPDSVLASSHQRTKASENLMRSIHAQRAAYFHYQSNHLAKLEKVHAKGAATAYEVAQNRSRLAIAQGDLESLQPSLEILGLEQALHVEIGDSRALRTIHDLGDQGSQLLTQIAAAQQRPNPGEILRLEAAEEFAQRRADRMEPLVAKGYATRLEQAEAERNSATYRIIAQSERQRELAVIPAMKLIEPPSSLPEIPLADLIVEPLN